MNESMNKEELNEQTVEQTDDQDIETSTVTDEQQEAPIEKSIEEKYSELQKEYTDLKDQYLRKLAEFDNYRKRMIREKQEAFDYANTNLLKDLIAILDDFDRALTVSPKVEGNVEVTSFVDGVKMINKQLVNMLDAKYNLTSYCVAGDSFNPDIHEAIGSLQMPVAEPVCAEVYLKGYMLKERVVRHAKVMVHMPDGTVNAEEDKNSQESE